MVSSGARRVAVIGALIAIAATLAAVCHWRQSTLDTKPLLGLTFAHADHRDVNCISCHHNFADATGQGFCIDCHKTNPKVRLQIEPMFHTLCRDCHVARHADGKDAGPVRRCVDCHTTDEAF